MIKLRVLQRHLSYYKHPIISQKMGHHPYISSDIETKEIEHRQIDKQTVDDQSLALEFHPSESDAPKRKRGRPRKDGGVPKKIKIKARSKVPCGLERTSPSRDE